MRIESLWCCSELLEMFRRDVARGCRLRRPTQEAWVETVLVDCESSWRLWLEAERALRGDPTAPPWQKIYPEDERD